MNKKILMLLIIILIPLNLTGCTFKVGNYTINNFQVTKKKPASSYYTEELTKKLKASAEFKAVMLDMNLYKEIILKNDDLDTVKSFFNSIKKSNFKEASKDIPNKPVYKLFLTISDEKYVINIYSQKYISLHPWDGDFSMDYIDTENIQPLYNLFGLCKYLMPE